MIFTWVSRSSATIRRVASKTVAVRHSDVHEHHIRDKTRGKPHRIVPIGGLADYLHIVLGIQQRPESSAYKRLIVGEQDSDHSPAPGVVKGLPSSGSRANTRNPPSGRGSGFDHTTQGSRPLLHTENSLTTPDSVVGTSLPSLPTSLSIRSVSSCPITGHIDARRGLT